MVMKIKKSHITGLCGGVHSSVSRAIRKETEKDPTNIRIVCVGDKSRSILQRPFPKNLLLTCNEVGRVPPTFTDAAKLTNEILNSGYEFGSGKIVYNRFKSVVSYTTTELPVFTLAAIQVSHFEFFLRIFVTPDFQFTKKTNKNQKIRQVLNYVFFYKAAPKLSLYDSVDNDVLQSYLEFSLAALIFYTFKEGACSEQASRMTAMDNASKNAGEMIDKLTLTFNRTRQAVITRELIEIISGAAALS